MGAGGGCGSRWERGVVCGPTDVQTCTLRVLIRPPGGKCQGYLLSEPISGAQRAVITIFQRHYS